MGGRGVAASPADAAPADLVLTGGTVITLDAARPRATAIAVRDGRIVAVGERRRDAGAGRPRHAARRPARPHRGARPRRRPRARGGPRRRARELDLVGAATLDEALERVRAGRRGAARGGVAARPRLGPERLAGEAVSHRGRPRPRRRRPSRLPDARGRPRRLGQHAGARAGRRHRRHPRSARRPHPARRRGAAGRRARGRRRWRSSPRGSPRRHPRGAQAAPRARACRPARRPG